VVGSANTNHHDVVVARQASSPAEFRYVSGDRIRNVEVKVAVSDVLRCAERNFPRRLAWWRLMFTVSHKAANPIESSEPPAIRERKWLIIDFNQRAWL